MLMQITTALAWLAGPLALLAMIDDWFLRPRRRLAALPAEAADPPLMRAVYLALPVVIVGAIARLLMSEQLDFSLVLVLVLALSLLVWALGPLPARRRVRARAAERAGVSRPIRSPCR